MPLRTPALKYTGIVGWPAHDTVGAPAPPLATGCVTHAGVTLLTAPSVASEKSRFTVSAASVYGLAAAIHRAPVVHAFRRLDDRDQ